jgi:microcystin-dependent protein
MAQPYIGEIRMFAGSFAPAGWMFCEGQLIPIAENDALFVVVGTTYGGDGESTFGLPDLRGRLPLHQGPGFTLGQADGVETVTLSTQQMPIHSHPLLVSTNSANQNSPLNSLPGNSASLDLYRESSPSVALNAQAVSPVGGSQPHSNLQPYLCVSFIISLFGLFPSPT